MSEKVYIGPNLPNLMTIAICVGVIMGLLFAVHKLSASKPEATEAAQ